MSRWTFTLPDDLARQVDERLAENCQNRSEVLRYLLEHYLETPAWSVKPGSASEGTPSSGSGDAASGPADRRATRKLKRPAPNREQLAEAQRLAAELGRDIPDEALAYGSACSDFIRKAKQELSKPT